MRIIVPIIKLKAAQSRSELRNLPYHQKKAKSEKIYRIFVSKVESNQHDLSTLMENAGVASEALSSPSIEGMKTAIKSNLLKFELEKKLLSIELEQANSEQNMSQLG